MWLLLGHGQEHFEQKPFNVVVDRSRPRSPSTSTEARLR